MVILRYSPSKLYKALALTGALTLLMLFVVLHPEAMRDSIRGWIFTTSFGHFVLAPALFLGSLAVAINFALIASGDLAAIRSGPDGLRIRAFWRIHHIPWTKLLRTRIETKVYRRTIWYQLLFDVSDGGLGYSVTLNSRETEASPNELPDVLARIEQRRVSELATKSGKAAHARSDALGLSRPAASASTDLPASDFDPDAALARHLARKAASTEEAPAGGPTAPPVSRPSFGRKGLA